MQRVQDTDGAPSDQAQERSELTEPYFSATVRLVSQDASVLDDGELARVKFRSPEKVTLWRETRAAFARWMRKYGA